MAGKKAPTPITNGEQFFLVRGEPARRIARYGKLVRGWNWRTTPELLKKADAKRQELGISQTELLERALIAFLETK